MARRGKRERKSKYDFYDSGKQGRSWKRVFIKSTLGGGNNIFYKRRQVTTEEGEELAKENNVIFIETSAKTSYNVEDVIIMTVLLWLSWSW